MHRSDLLLFPYISLAPLAAPSFLLSVSCALRTCFAFVPILRTIVQDELLNTSKREREEGEQRVFDNGVGLALHWKLRLPGVPTVCNKGHTYIPTTPKSERL